MTLKFITLPNGQQLRWKDVLRLRREQEKQARQPTQPALFEMYDDSRPHSQKDAAGRFTEPLLFKD